MSKKSGIFVGIDFGTSNSCIAIYKDEKVEDRITPSYVYIGENGEPHVGKSAKNYGHKKPERLFYDMKRLFATKTSDQIYKKYKNQWTFDIKRDTETGYCNYNIDGKIYTPEEISSEVLKKLLSYVGENVDGVVLTVPAFFSTEQKNKILEAAEMAGITVLQLICEPTAAAIAYGMEHSYTNGEILFVFDMGGGTFDITIIKILNSKDFEVIVLGGDSHLGARDFDGVIIDWLLKKLEDIVGKNGVKKLMPRKKYKIMEMAKEAKEALSQAEDAVLQLSEVHSDASDVILTRAEFEELSKGLLAKVKECIESTLKCKALNQQEINHVLFVGGASKMPMIAKLLKQYFSKARFTKTVNAEEIVALGATRLAAKLGKPERSDMMPLVFKEFMSPKFGIEYVDENGKNVFKNIFDSNTPYHQVQVINLTKTEKDQKGFEIVFYEGMYEQREKNTHIGSMKFKNLSTEKADIRFTIDEDGTVEISHDNTSVQYRTHLYDLQKPSFQNEEKFNAAGIDFGNTTCFAAIARNNDNEAITLGNNNEKAILSYVSYDERHEKCGKGVVNRMLWHAKSTIYDIKKIIGKDFESIEIDDKWPFKIIKTDTSVSIEIESFNGQILKDPEEALSDILKHVKEKLSEENDKRNFKEIVLSIPANFNNKEKEAILKAAELAKLKNVILLSDPISAFYSYYMTLPNFNKYIILIFDLGGTSLDLSVLRVNDNEIDILKTCSNSNLGGRYFNTVLKNYIEYCLITEKNCDLNEDKKQYEIEMDSITIKESLSCSEEYE